MSSETVDRAGHTISGSQLDSRLSDACGLTRDSSAEQWAKCARRLGVHDLVRFHPDSHFWPLQLIETALFGGAALALIGFAAWWTLRRVA